MKNIYFVFMLLSCCYTGNYSYRENNVGNGLNDTPLPGKVWHFTDVHLDPLYTVNSSVTNTITENQL